MQFEMKIDAEAVQQQVVASIISSAIGEQIKASITKALTETTGDWSNRKTLVQRAVDEALAIKVREFAIELVRERAEDIRAQLKDKLTDEVLLLMTDAAWGVMEGRLKNA
jgi:carbon monoxide dehydrogenase subunit G